jgi:hypothetical protein
MIGRILFDSDHWLVSVGLFGGFKVLHKERELIVKASSPERRHLNDTVALLKLAGLQIDPSNKELAELFEMFADAVFGQGDSRWQAYFQQTPAALAAEIVANVAKAKQNTIHSQTTKIDVQSGLVMAEIDALSKGQSLYQAEVIPFEKGAVPNKSGHYYELDGMPIIITRIPNIPDLAHPYPRKGSELDVKKKLDAEEVVKSGTEITYDEFKKLVWG